MIKANNTHSSPENEWEVQKAKLLIKYPYLTNEDLHYEVGKRDLMLNNVQIILGKTKDQLTEILATL